MRTLKTVKWVCMGILLVSLIFTAFCLAQPVRFRKSNYGSSGSYGSSYGSSTSSSSGSSSNSSGSSSNSSESSSNSSGSSSPSKKTLKVYTCNSMKIGLPSEYSSVLSVQKLCETGKIYNRMLRVYEKGSKEESEKDFDESLGLLFEIGYVKIGKYDDFVDLDFPASYVFAKDSTNYYIYTEPTDYQFYRSDGGTSKEQELWQELQALGADVKSYFLEINDVDKCTVKPENNEQSTSTTPPETANDLCSHCDGSGACSHCLFGDCPSCYGKGRFNCTSCVGLGHCLSCGGKGYTYKGTGKNFRKVDCSRCSGLGDCRSCYGKGYSPCYACSSTGNCSICAGSGRCQYCYGTGKR